jgi:hypothetical protein
MGTAKLALTYAANRMVNNKNWVPRNGYPVFFVRLRTFNYKPQGYDAAVSYVSKTTS